MSFTGKPGHGQDHRRPANGRDLHTLGCIRKGRSVRNAIDRLRMRHAIRLWHAATEEGKKLTKGDLVTIQAEDVRKSRVFDEEAQPDREETH